MNLTHSPRRSEDRYDDNEDPILPTAASRVPTRRDPRVPRIDPPAEPTMADLLAAFHGTAAAAKADNLALAAEIAILKGQLAARMPEVSEIALYRDVHDLPLRTSLSAFDAASLKHLPKDLDALREGPTPMLQVGENKFWKAVQARKPANYSTDYRKPGTQEGITVALEKELSPLLTMQAVLELGADVHTALKNAQGNEDTDPAEFFAAVDTAA